MDYIDIRMLRLEKVGPQPFAISGGGDVATKLKELRVKLHKMEEMEEKLAA